MGGRLQGGSYPAQYHGFGTGHGAELWSGAIATSFNPDGSFSTTDQSTASTYARIMESGVGGRTADVTNSSWGSTEPTGFTTRAAGIDGLINRNGTVAVFSAGNRGPGPNTVGNPASGYNAIAVGALGSDTSSPPYNTVSGFSSRGPNDFLHPVTGLVPAAISQRAEVDIAAPGQNLTLAVFEGEGAPTDLYFPGLLGTSFAAPLVAGGAALLVDAGYDLYGGGAAIDGRVIKAVLQNSADKTAGWNNGQLNNAGIITTTQSLDYAVGAGRMNLDAAFDQYVRIAAGGDAGTTDVPGLGGAFVVSPVGWDFGDVDAGGSSLYFISDLLQAGTLFNATLAWWADRNPGNVDPVSADFSGADEEHLANLNLFIFEYDPTNFSILNTVAQSISNYNVVEHLSFLLPQTGFYGIRVNYDDAWWNFTGQSGELYGLAWDAGADDAGANAVPEPSSAALLTAASLGVALYRRRGRQQELASVAA
jgi:hypothetical protein